MENKLDIIVFGATGFTGKHTFPYLHKLCQQTGRQLTWGIGGRSKQKLKEVLHEYAQKLDANALTSIPIIIADVTNELSILEMAKKARVIINCCGPYQLYGEIVVKCCVMAGTNYVDVTGEPYFQELMLSKYKKSAEEKGIYIVNSCGFDSLGSELLLTFITKSFQGTLNSAEIFTSLLIHAPEAGPYVNSGTWASIVTSLGQLRSALGLRRVNNITSISTTSPNCSFRLPFTKDASIGIPNKWIVPYPSPDSDVVKRSQLYFYENDGKRPIQVRHYYLMDSWKNILLIVFFGLFVIILSQCQCGRKLLLKYPKFFSAGYFDHESPTEELSENIEFDVYFYGKGWKETNEKDNKFTTPPNKSILGRLVAVNPGYGFTCLAVVLSAIMILTEPSNLPKKGGVYSPAAAFFKTSLVEEMQKNGVPLEILSVNDL
ncbi:hypothetical protein RI129_001391 [Pyrocoelia pectoralis]|uniref:Saccharopine dehydrogenase NADP binding domain-containing protein n=1 Tax=Pyrocoelia pectoralis TaxID=417401 RepID=A0AAN7ZPN8_9COLE